MTQAEAALGAATDRFGGHTLVGRAAEIARLDAVLDRLGRGSPAIVDLTGAAGIGKSRLVGEVCRRARRRGATVLRGWATEYEQHLPFQPFADALADALADVDDRGPSVASELLDAVAPVLGGRATGPSPVTGPPHVDRFALHRSTARLLAQLGAEGLVVALDDMHWADPASLELLDHLVRHPVPGPVVLVVARRDRQTPPALAAALTRGLDTASVLRIDLAPLEEQECVEGLASDLSRVQAARLHAASEGNPLYFLSLLHAHRVGTAQGGASPSASAGDGADGLPAGLGSLLLDELTPLTPSQRRTLEVVAVLGDHATHPVTGATARRTGAELDDDLEALARRDLVRAGTGGRLVLRHPVLRTLVHESTPAWRRADIHRAAAVELARAGAPAVDQAQHIERSVTEWDARAIAVLERAADETEAKAPTSCAHWLGAVLRLLPDTAEHAVERRRLTLRRARALGVSGGLRESRELLHQVISASDQDEDGVRTSAVVLCALVERHLGRYAEAIALLRRELRRKPGPSAAERVSIGLELGSSAPHNTPYPQVRDEVAGTLSAARLLEDEPGEAGALALSAFGEAYEGATATAAGFVGQAAELMDGLPDDVLQPLCEPLARLGWAEAFLGRFTDAERHADRGLEIARRSGQVYLLPLLLLCKAHVRIQTCRLPSARQLADEAEDIARGIGSGELLAFVLANKAQVLIVASAPGDPEALAVAEEAVAGIGPRDNWRASMAWCMLGYAALTGGDPHRARDALLRAGGDHLHGLQPSMRPLFLELLVTAALLTGDIGSAFAWAERARKEADLLGLPLQRASALRSAAQLSLHGGDPATAATLLSDAAEECARSGAVFWEARSLLIAAPVLTAAGLPARGEAALERGRRLATTGGAHLLAGLAAMAGASAPPERPGIPQQLVSLTAREREVAELVAEGLTNQAIADRLYLSPRTVETHLSRVYRKTDVTSRAALAALIARF
ncbi:MULTISPECIES: ATP-binding protein [unclassified Streptomyces]|uniref:ATP-binding protein n=1 Tax=unclassified Streptomyces TaxID=2593676 RepID=UPI00093FC466|nr:LuxR family transcriptional regulator [Streptomyces sp. CB02058]OKI89114.1 LuxR family transcriptional regulator [Streptomyces sp. CB02058]